MNELDRTGIYKIVNTVTNDFYIGSTKVCFRRRFCQHKSDLRKNIHKNIHLQRAYNKYGKNNFSFIILEVMDNLDEIVIMEQLYIDYEKPKYNIIRDVENYGLGRTLTPEQKLAHSERMRKRRGIPSWNKGLKFSLESRLKMSKSMKGRVCKYKGVVGRNYNPVIREDGVIFKNPYYAALELNVKPNTIIKAISDKTKVRRVKGFTFKYYNLDKQDYNMLESRNREEEV